MKFTDLNLEPSLFAAIEKQGYSECTQIQSATIPHIAEGRDVSGLAQTGTGKTAAFLIPLMDRILKARVNPEGLSDEARAALEKRRFSDWRAHNFILILVPTRELAEQVYENTQKLSEMSGLRGVSVYGGTGYEKQKEAFRQGVEFVIATPGRLIDLYKEHIVDLKQVRAIVFDEADRMFDMGFKDDMKFILQRVPRERQFLVFSATLNFDVLNTAYMFGAEPVEVNVSRDQAKAENVKDEIFHVGQHDKPMYLLSMLKKYNPRQAIIFSNFKFSVERIAHFLNQNGIPAMAISSLLTQAQRNRVIELFKAENEKNILVATDVAARGLDIKGVDMVINFELPNDAESYVHRIGRTGRAGAEGRAFSMVGDRDVEALTRIEDFLKHKLAVGWIEDTELIQNYKPFPAESSSYGKSYEEPSRAARSDRRPPRGGHQDRRRDDRGRGDRPRDDRGRAGGGGPRAHSSRSHHQGGRPTRPQQGASTTSAAPSSSHRSASSGGNGSQRPLHGKPRGPSHHHKRQGPRPSARSAYQPRSPASHQKSLVQKVSGFFKKLFE